MDLTNTIVGKVKVIKRGPDFDGLSDLRAQWFVECLICKNRELVVARDLKRYKLRFKEGCRGCTKFRTKPRDRYKYGRNINGFIDKNVIVKE